ncbi:MAG: hypothetical protein OEY88_01655 [Candidatus Bathyarchaeota archaeon]|nr:hypothetical protein [Candidatus Bathyarchaeota archaeon]
MSLGWLVWKEYEKTNRAKRGNRVVVGQLVLPTVGCLMFIGGWGWVVG